jgi:hypothetical protein
MSNTRSHLPRVHKGWVRKDETTHPLRGVDSPSIGAVSPYLGLWLLNHSACKIHLHCIFYIVISCSCFEYLLWNHFFYPYSFSSYLQKILLVFHRDDRESTSGGCFSILV